MIWLLIILLFSMFQNRLYLIHIHLIILFLQTKSLSFRRLRSFVNTKILLLLYYLLLNILIKWITLYNNLIWVNNFVISLLDGYFSFYNSNKLIIEFISYSSLIWHLKNSIALSLDSFKIYLNKSTRNFLKNF